MPSPHDPPFLQSRNNLRGTIFGPVENADDDESFLGRQGRGREAERAEIRTDIIVNDDNDVSALFGWLWAPFLRARWYWSYRKKTAHGSG